MQWWCDLTWSNHSLGHACHLYSLYSTSRYCRLCLLTSVPWFVWYTGGGQRDIISMLLTKRNWKWSRLWHASITVDHSISELLLLLIYKDHVNQSKDVVTKLTSGTETTLEREIGRKCRHCTCRYQVRSLTHSTNYHWTTSCLILVPHSWVLANGIRCLQLSPIEHKVAINQEKKIRWL